MLLDYFIPIAFWGSLGGTLFAVYMTGHRLFLKVCPFNEECPIFLGHPACYYGLAMFLVMLGAATGLMYDMVAMSTAVYVLGGTSALGILFAGQYVVADVSAWLVHGRKYGLVLPACAWGMIFYAIVLAISVLWLMQ